MCDTFDRSALVENADELASVKICHVGYSEAKKSPKGYYSSGYERRFVSRRSLSKVCATLPINVRTAGSTAITAFRSMSPFPVLLPPEYHVSNYRTVDELDLFAFDRRCRAPIPSPKYLERYIPYMYTFGCNVSPKRTSSRARARVYTRTCETIEKIDERAICTHVIITKKFRVR